MVTSWPSAAAPRGSANCPSLPVSDDPRIGDAPADGEVLSGDVPVAAPDSRDAEPPPMEDAQAPTSPPPVPIPPTVDVHDLDWERIAASVAPGAVRARMRGTVEQLETLLDSERGLQMLFDEQRESRADRAIGIDQISDAPLWFIGDLHGDLLAFEA